MSGLQKQMLFMRCVYESQVDQLTIFPFPGLKIINIRGNALLALDLIVINHFITHLQHGNNLLELSLRDQVLSNIYVGMSATFKTENIFTPINHEV